MAEQAQTKKADHLKDTFLSDIAHTAKVTLCAIMSNKLGEVVYAFHLEDEKNLSQPVGFELTVYPDGHTEYLQVDHEEMLELIEEETATGKLNSE